MNADLTTQLLAQLDLVLNSYREVRARSRYHDLSDLPAIEQHRLISMSRAAIERVAGRESVYARQAQGIIDRSNAHDGLRASMLAGVVESLRGDLASGFLQTVAELIHGEVFGDFLEMSEHLLEGGYKDAAAVIAGGTLEAHLLTFA